MLLLKFLVNFFSSFYHFKMCKVIGRENILNYLVWISLIYYLRQSFVPTIMIAQILILVLKNYYKINFLLPVSYGYNLYIIRTIDCFFNTFRSTNWHFQKKMLHVFIALIVFYAIFFSYCYENYNTLN